MANVKIYKQTGKEAGVLELSDAVFSAEYNEPLIHRAVAAHLANARQGTKGALTRTEVRGGGRKPWRQKGTGRARQGSTRSPQWKGGGVVFAPKERDFSQKINKTAKAQAFKSAISAKLAQGDIIIVDELKLKEVKTREMAAVFQNLKLDKSVLLVLAKGDAEARRASGNLAGVTVTQSDLIGVYDVVANNKCLMTVDAVKKIEEAYGA